MLLVGGNDGNTVTTSLSAGKSLTYDAGSGSDHVFAGAEDDTITAPVSALGTDQFILGDGFNSLHVQGAGVVNLSGVRGLDALSLDSAGTNTAIIARSE
jgi:hypothetical protein